MISRIEFIRLQEKVRSNHGRLFIFFINSDHGIEVSDRIFAFNKRTGERVEWPRAFGTMSALEIINNMRVEKIIYQVSGTEHTYKNLEELLSNILA